MRRMRRSSSCWSRYKNINLSDKSQWANTSFAFTRQLYNMLELARVIVQGARLRDESRGAHYKPDFPDRNDEQLPEDDQGGVRRWRAADYVRGSGYAARSSRGRGFTRAPKGLRSALTPRNFSRPMLGIMDMHPTLTTFVYVALIVVAVAVATYVFLYTRGVAHEARHPQREGPDCR